eukprot:SAG31_NODE_5959_length_2241_cov_1.092904_3_plen_43_part_01
MLFTSSLWSLLLFWLSGLFIDDSTGLGSEHSSLLRKTGMAAKD